MTDPLHPMGKCRCAGEGACAWCLANEASVHDERIRAEGAAAADSDSLGLLPEAIRVAVGPLGVAAALAASIARIPDVLDAARAAGAAAERAWCVAMLRARAESYAHGGRMHPDGDGMRFGRCLDAAADAIAKGGAR